MPRQHQIDLVAPLPITEVAIYRHRGVWCYAARNKIGFDHSDTIDVLDSDTETTVRAEVARQFPAADIRRCQDVN